MTIDNTLTFEVARRQIGDLAPIKDIGSHLGRLQYVKDHSSDQGRVYRFEASETHWDMSWIFNHNSEIMLALGHVREQQERYGMKSKEVIRGFQRLLNAVTFSAIPLYLDSYSIDFGNDYLFEDGTDLMHATTFLESLYNVIEYGSDFGERGDVMVRILGGRSYNS